MADDKEACEVFLTPTEQKKEKKKPNQEQLVADLVRRLRAEGIACEVRDIQTH